MRRVVSRAKGIALAVARSTVGASRVHGAGKALRRARIRAGARRVTFRGARLELDPGSANSESVLAGRFERSLLDFVLARVRPGRTCVDVGAHVGYWTLPLAAAVGPTGRVVAVEPHAPNVERLRRNLRLNGMQNTEIVHAAAQAASGTADLRVSGTSTSWNSIVTSGTYFHDAVAVVSVPAVALDDLDLPGSVELLKIDVEGAEEGVLEGARSLLGRTRMLVLEIGGPRVTSESYVAGVTGLLYENFADVRVVDKSADRLVRVSTAAELRSRWTDRADVTKVVASRLEDGATG